MSIFADSILLVYSRDTNGRKTIMALTDTKVRSAKSEEKEYSLVDGDGMSLLVNLAVQSIGDFVSVLAVNNI